MIFSLVLGCFGWYDRYIHKYYTFHAHPYGQFIYLHYDIIVSNIEIMLGGTFKGQWRQYQQRVLDKSESFMDDGKIHLVAALSGKTI